MPSTAYGWLSGGVTGILAGHPTVIIADPAEPDWSRRVKSLTLNTYAGNASLVSFIDEASGLDLAGHRVRHWRDMIDPNVIDIIWRQSYHQVKEIIWQVDPALRCWISYRLHPLADALTRYRIWQQLLLTTHPQLVLLPQGSELIRLFKRGAVFRAHGAGSRLLAGYQNAARVRRWLKMQGGKGRQTKVPDSQAKLQNHPSVMMVVEDGVSAVHIGPAMAIADALSMRGFAPRIVTTNPAILSAMAARGHDAVETRAWAIGGIAYSCAKVWRPLRATLLKFGNTQIADPVATEFINWVIEQVPMFVAKRAIMLESFRRQDMIAPVSAVLTMGETFPSALVAIEWARSADIPCLGFFPVLIGERPDNDDFPALHHLVYGEQAASHMRKLGVRTEAIQVVGSPTFDGVLGRDRAADIEAVRKMIPAWNKGERLMVIATEALPDPLVELIPALRVARHCPGVRTVVKVHPADSVIAMESIVGSEGLAGEVPVLGKCDLAALLHAADLLVCTLSNIAVTAAVLGTPTLVLAFGGRHRPVDFVAEGLGVGCLDAEHLPAMIAELIEDGPARDAAIGRMKSSLFRFNGPCDGKSHLRVADVIQKIITKH